MDKWADIRRRFMPDEPKVGVSDNATPVPERGLRISDLQKILAAAKRKHGDLPVIFCRYSDYENMVESDVEVIDAWHKDGVTSYAMRDHCTLSDATPPHPGWVKGKFVLFPGN